LGRTAKFPQLGSQKVGAGSDVEIARPESDRAQLALNLCSESRLTQGQVVGQRQRTARLLWIAQVRRKVGAPDQECERVPNKLLTHTPFALSNPGPEVLERALCVSGAMPSVDEHWEDIAPAHSPR